MDSKSSASSKFLPILVVALVGAAFAIGMLWGKVKSLESGIVANNDRPRAEAQEQEGVAAQPPTTPETTTASVDDDPVLGDANAPITLIEFSDYECPFCKRHFDEVYPDLKANYIDSGQVKLVFRDLPLPFHDPMATKEAVAANCARDQGGDDTYFEYHDEIFNRTTSNGNGLTEGDLSTIASDLGLDVSSFESCLDDPTQEEEVKNDLKEANAAGATGTPSFVIGKSSNDGVIEGQLIVGAQPLAAFEAAIAELE